MSDCLASDFDEPSLIPYGTVWPEAPEATENVQTEVTDDMAERSRRWLVDHLDNLSGGIDSFFVDRFFNDDVTESYGSARGIFLICLSCFLTSETACW